MADPGGTMRTDDWTELASGREPDDATLAELRVWLRDAEPADLVRVLRSVYLAGERTESRQGRLL
jgi:hypothetical protein